MELWLLRHARARAATAREHDKDRKLTDSGRMAARKLNGWIQESGLALPRKILVSPAVRTRETAEIVLDNPEAPEPLIEPALWEALEEDLLGIIQKHAKSASLMLIGHNPGIEWLVQWLTKQRPRLGIQPGTLAILEISVPLSPGCGRIDTMVQPSDLT